MSDGDAVLKRGTLKILEYAIHIVILYSYLVFVPLLAVYLWVSSKCQVIWFLAGESRPPHTRFHVIGKKFSWEEGRGSFALCAGVSDSIDLHNVKVLLCLSMCHLLSKHSLLLLLLKHLFLHLPVAEAETVKNCPLLEVIYHYLLIKTSHKNILPSQLPRKLFDWLNDVCLLLLQVVQQLPKVVGITLYDLGCRQRTQPLFLDCWLQRNPLLEISKKFVPGDAELSGCLDQKLSQNDGLFRCVEVQHLSYFLSQILLTSARRLLTLLALIFSWKFCLIFTKNSLYCVEFIK